MEIIHVGDLLSSQAASVQAVVRKSGLSLLKAVVRLAVMDIRCREEFVVIELTQSDPTRMLSEGG